MTTHTLKCWTEQFSEVRSGRKTFEFRREDRGFAVGDVLDLRDFDPVGMMYSGQFELRRVTHILSSGFGLPDGFVVMSLEAVECCGEPVHDGDPCGYILECCGKYRAPAPQTNVAGDSQPRYTTMRLHDEIAKARAYGMELAASMCIERAAEYDASFEETKYKTETLAAGAALVAIAGKIREKIASQPPQQHVVGMDEEDRTPMPDGYDPALWQKADEVHHAMALVADDTECVKILYAELLSTDDDKLKSKPDFYAEQVDQLAFELAYELEEAEMNRNDLVSINREKLNGIATRVLSRLKDQAPSPETKMVGSK